MKTLAIDIETYSSVDLGKSGVYTYTEAEDFEILLFAYCFDDEEIQIVALSESLTGITLFILSGSFR
jgi:DNA polymerase